MSNTTAKNNALSPQPPKDMAMIAREEASAMQEVQAAMVIAKKFPRNYIQAQDRILQACTRPKLAETALYSYTKGGTDITGPSIRLAEVLAQSWGNMQCGIRELSQVDGESTVEAYAVDLETNYRQSKVFQVPHIRYYSGGTSKKLTDPREIYENVANNGARRLRACILAVIPGDVIESAVKQCEITIKTNVDVTPDGIKVLLEAFESVSVTQSMLEKRIQCRMEAIRPAQVVNLRKIYTSIRDGMSMPADWFDMEAVKSDAPGSKKLPGIADAEFAAKLPGYLETIKSGVNTAETIVAMLSSKYTLTEQQITQLKQPQQAAKPDDDWGRDYDAEMEKQQ